MGPELFAAAAALATVGAALFLAVFGAVPSGRSRPAIVALAAGAGIVLAALVAVAPTFDGERSVAGLAAKLKPRLHPGDEIAAYRGYPQDLPVYLGRTITVAAYEDELAFGIHAEATGAWMIDEAAFWRRREGPRRMYAVMETEIYDDLAREGRAMAELARDDAHVLVGNAAAQAAVRARPSP